MQTKPTNQPRGIWAKQPLDSKPASQQPPRHFKLSTYMTTYAGAVQVIEPCCKRPFYGATRCATIRMSLVRSSNSTLVWVTKRMLGFWMRVSKGFKSVTAPAPYGMHHSRASIVNFSPQHILFLHLGKKATWSHPKGISYQNRAVLPQLVTSRHTNGYCLWRLFISLQRGLCLISHNSE